MVTGETLPFVPSISADVSCRGSAIAKIVAENTQQFPDIFERDVQMWVFEEEVKIPESSKHYDSGSELSTKPQKLTEIINRLHENPKYLPNIPLPTNLVANPSVEDSVKNSSILIFNMPHQFISRICDQMKGSVLPFARGISCIKGVDVTEDGINLFTDTISAKLGIYCGALSGANIATEVALEKFSETTIAYDPPTVDSKGAGDQSDAPVKKGGKPLQPMPAEYPPLTRAVVKQLFHRPYFHVATTHDVAGVCLGGALKNVVALAAGFVDGLGWGDNAKAAVMRVGILEQVKFGNMFFPDEFDGRTMTEESCGIADMITSCSGGRNFRCAKMSVAEGISIKEVEKRELNGQVLQGTATAQEVYKFLKKNGKDKEFPLLVVVWGESIGVRSQHGRD